MHSLVGNGLTSRGVAILFDRFKNCHSTISWISITENNVDDNCMAALGEYIKHNENIAGVYVMYAQISDRGVEILSDHILGNKTIYQFDFQGNVGITDQSAQYFIDIAKNTYVNNIYVSDTSISDEKHEEILRYLVIPNEEREISKIPAKMP